MSESVKRNYLTPDKTAWSTPDGIIHIDAVRMCEVLGLKPTRANQDRMEAEAAVFFSKKIPGIDIYSISDLT